MMLSVALISTLLVMAVDSSPLVASGTSAAGGSSPRLTLAEHEAALARGEARHHTHPQEHATCDKHLCASIVSYCLIQEACSCDTSTPARNCSCCRHCAVCLGDKFDACSDCVGIREKSDYSSVATSSHVSEHVTPPDIELLDEPAPELFAKWTDRRSPSVHYSIYRYPNVEQLTSALHHHHHHRHHQQQNSGAAASSLEVDAHRRFTSRDYQMALSQVEGANAAAAARMVCTAAYFDRCMQLHECRNGCRSIGATMIAFFAPAGCCGCLGDACRLRDHTTYRPKCRACADDN